MLFGIAATPGAKIPAVALTSMTCNIAIYLRERGEVSADVYASSCRREAHFALQEGGRSGGEESTAALLRIIGTTLLEEADQHAGGAMVPMSFVRKTLSETTRRVRSTFSKCRTRGTCAGRRKRRRARRRLRFFVDILGGRRRRRLLRRRGAQQEVEQGTRRSGRGARSPVAVCCERFRCYSTRCVREGLRGSRR